jgi:hypothetical protein
MKTRINYYTQEKLHFVDIIDEGGLILTSGISDISKQDAHDGAIKILSEFGHGYTYRNILSK